MPGIRRILFFTILAVTVTLPARAEGGHHSWRYVFPFFPDELDVLLGHLRTTVERLKEVLAQCRDMIEGEWTGDEPNGVQLLSAPERDDDDDNSDMESKVENILELRERISELEDKIEECRFHFWTGDEANDK